MSYKIPPEERTYANALKLLKALQSNRAVTSAIAASASDPSKPDMNASAIPEMLEWISKAGYDVSDFSDLNVVHVAGTKGKGSVCAIVTSILRQYNDLQPQKPPSSSSSSSLSSPPLDPTKIGLYTSPHLVTVRERIQLTNEPLPVPLFTASFFELWDRLSHSTSTSTSNTTPPSPSSAATKPNYFRLLTLLFLHLLHAQRPRSAVLECGIGGQHDSTNVLPGACITATAVTRLGLDHTGMLGGSLASIAWHKAGIMRAGRRCFTPAGPAGQPAAAMRVLRARAAESAAELVEVAPLGSTGLSASASASPPAAPSPTSLAELLPRLDGAFQAENAALAIALAGEHLRALGFTAGADAVPERVWELPAAELPPRFLRGLREARWPGRCEVREDAKGSVEWFVDGAHTAESLAVAAEWFVEKVARKNGAEGEGTDEEEGGGQKERAPLESVRPEAMMLIFNQQERDAPELLAQLLECVDKRVAAASGGEYTGAERRGKVFGSVVFTRSEPFASGQAEGSDLGVQEGLKARWIEEMERRGAGGGKLGHGGGRSAGGGNEARDVMVSRNVEGAVMMARQKGRELVESGGETKLRVLVTGSLHLVGGLLAVLDGGSDDAI